MRLIHICPDEKFIDAAWEAFEAVEPGKSRYLVLGDERELRHISRAPVEFTGKKPWRDQELYKILRNASCVILHSLNGNNVRLVNSKYARSINFVWVGFGYDYYDTIAGSVSGLYLSRTAELLHSRSCSLKEQLSRWLRVKPRGVLLKHWRRKAINRINYFSPVLEAEYELVKASFRGNANFPNLARYNYGVNAKLFEKLAEEEGTKLGPNILLGNSSNPTNNHIEAIDLLSGLNLGERMVIAPLSYGHADDRYIESVCSYGVQKLGDNFKPIMGFLPYEEYVDLLSSCGIVLMNHKRQQALGNLQMQIARGATVFLRRDNPVFAWYDGMGVVVRDIENISGCRSISDMVLDFDSSNSNRRIVVENFGWNMHLNLTRRFIDQVTDSE